MRILREHLTGYLFVAPASVLLFIFGIFPVAFAFFVSLNRWRRTPDEFQGLDQYVNALGDFAYVLFFWLALGFIAYGVQLFWRSLKSAPRALVYWLPASVIAAALGAATVWFFALLLKVLEIPQRLRGQAITSEAFLREFGASFAFPEVQNALTLTLWIGAAAVAFTVLTMRLLKLPQGGLMMRRASLSAVMILAGGWLLLLTVSEVNLSILEARADGESLALWTQVLIVSAGAGLLGAAYLLWQHAVAHNTQRFLLTAFWAVMAALGAVLLIREIPLMLQDADSAVLNGFGVAVMYSAFSVPLQLALGLLLAVMLFQKIKGRGIYRVIYFLPYITPLVATSTVFALIFSHNANSPVNQLLNLFGIADQTWLREPDGIFTLLFGAWVPDFLSGPSLALMVIILYNVWIYAGYSAVIFLAGLGGIPGDLYEAARIDGGNGWHLFRFITVPLLSPTTFFLILVSTIGTLQTFTQIYLLRRAGAYAAVDTVNIVIFNQIQRESPNYGYGSALAFVLFGVILLLSVIQNRVVGRRVFYG